MMGNVLALEHDDVAVVLVDLAVGVGPPQLLDGEGRLVLLVFLPQLHSSDNIIISIEYLKKMHQTQGVLL